MIAKLVALRHESGTSPSISTKLGLTSNEVVSMKQIQTDLQRITGQINSIDMEILGFNTNLIDLKEQREVIQKSNEEIILQTAKPQTIQIDLISAQQRGCSSSSIE